MGEGSKIGQICRRIVVKNCRREGGRGQKACKICRRLKWMVPKLKQNCTNLKLRYCEKATQFEKKNSLRFDIHSSMKIVSNCVAFSQYLNFN